MLTLATIDAVRRDTAAWGAALGRCHYSLASRFVHYVAVVVAIVEFRADSPSGQGVAKLTRQVAVSYHEFEGASYCSDPTLL